jgi:hypothetical protein
MSTAAIHKLRKDVDAAHKTRQQALAKPPAAAASKRSRDSSAESPFRPARDHPVEVAGLKMCQSFNADVALLIKLWKKPRNIPMVSEHDLVEEALLEGFIQVMESIQASLDVLSSQPASVFASDIMTSLTAEMNLIRDAYPHSHGFTTVFGPERAAEGVLEFERLKVARERQTRPNSSTGPNRRGGSASAPPPGRTRTEPSSREATDPDSRTRGRTGK